MAIAFLAAVLLLGFASSRSAYAAEVAEGDFAASQALAAESARAIQTSTVEATSATQEPTAQSMLTTQALDTQALDTQALDTQQSHNIIFEAGAGGTPSATLLSASYTTSILVYPGCDAGYNVASFSAKTAGGEDIKWTANYASVSGSKFTCSRNYQFSMPDDDVIVTITYKRDWPHSVTVSSSGQGTVTIERSKAMEGDPIRIAAKPASGYVFQGLQVWPENTITSYLFNDKPEQQYIATMPNDDLKVRAVFVKEDAASHKPSYRSVGEGTFVFERDNTSPGNKARRAYAGERVLIREITPENGYRFAGLTSDVAGVEIDNSFADGVASFIMPDSAVTITVNFVPGKPDQPIDVGAGSTLFVDAGETLPLRASAQGSLAYRSSNTAIAVVGSDGSVTGLKPGKATISVTAAETGEYAKTTREVAVVVTQTVEVPTAASGLVYDGKTQTGVAAASAYTVDGGTETNAGHYTATATLKDTERYQWPDYTTDPKSVDWEIACRSMAVVPVDTVKVQGYYDPELTATTEGLVEGDSVDYWLNRDAGEEPGEYLIHVKGNVYQGNYEISYGSGTFTITPLVFSLADEVKVYTGDELEYTGVVTKGSSDGEVDYGYYADPELHISCYIIDAGVYYVEGTLWPSDFHASPGFLGRSVAKLTVVPADNDVQIEKASVKTTLKAKVLKTKAHQIALPKVTPKFGDAKWEVVQKDKKGVLSLKAGKVKVKKGAKKGTYTMKLRANVPETKNYRQAYSKTVKVKVTVKA